MSAHDLILEGVHKTFRLATGSVDALSDIDLTVQAGEFLCIVGGSGCGKSTLLRLVMGLEHPTAGSVRIGQTPVTGAGTDRGMVFQEHRLFPWQTVEQNILFGITVSRNREERRHLVAEHIRRVGLQGFEKAYPHQLSGGMQQRVSLARALVNRPGILLLDEPFGALDALTRITMQEEILRLWQEEGTTMVLVTHDIDEALFLGDRVVVMSPRPGTIKRVLTIPMPRPRDRTDPDFAHLRREIYREFFAQDEKRLDYAI